MSVSDPRFGTLRQSAGDLVTDVIETLVRNGSDRHLNRINVFDVARRSDLPVDAVIGGFLHASRLGLFDMSWNVLCPGCGGVLEKGATLKTLRQSEYHCALCAAGYEPTLDEMVEVTFTVSPRVRRIAAHDPDTLPTMEYARQIFWSSGTDLPEEGLEELLQQTMIEALELPAGEKAILSMMLPEAFVIVFDPVTHSTQFLEVQGEPTRERQQLTRGVQQGAGADRGDPHAARAGAHFLREPDRRRACCPACSSPTTPSTPCWADASRSSLPSACSPTRPSATSTARTRWRWTSG